MELRATVLIKDEAPDAGGCVDEMGVGSEVDDTVVLDEVWRVSGGFSEGVVSCVGEKTILAWPASSVELVSMASCGCRLARDDRRDTVEPPGQST